MQFAANIFHWQEAAQLKFLLHNCLPCQAVTQQLGCMLISSG